MTQNNNLSVLPWYTSINEQNHKKKYAFGAVYALYAQKDFLLPFQIMRPTRSNNVTSIKAYKKSGSLIGDITEKMKNSGLTIVKFPQYGYDVICFPANLPLSADLREGQLYLVLSDGVQTWYSDILTLVTIVDPYLKIEWWDVENLVFDSGIIVYQNIGFKNRVYLNTELGKPEYTFEEEGSNRDGFFFPEKQVSEKTYKFNFLSSEYLLDAIRFIRMSDYKIITDKYGRVYSADTFLITPKWETQGDLASVESEFQTNTAVKKIGKGFYNQNSGDFNKDFNNDYKTTNN